MRTPELSWAEALASGDVGALEPIHPLGGSPHRQHRCVVSHRLDAGAGVPLHRRSPPCCTADRSRRPGYSLRSRRPPLPARGQHRPRRSRRSHLIPCALAPRPTAADQHTTSAPPQLFLGTLTPSIRAPSSDVGCTSRPFHWLPHPCDHAATHRLVCTPPLIADASQRRRLARAMKKRRHASSTG